LIGYENWNPQRDSKSDQEEGSEIGSGHTVTVLYEIVPASTGMNNSFVKPPADLLKYQRPRSAVGPPKEMDEQLSKEMATVRLRYKRPNSEATETIEGSFVDNGSNFQDAAPDLKFAAAVAEFGMILRDSPYKGTGTLGAVVEWAREGKGRDLGGTRAGFIELVRRTEALKGGEG
jgi:Ca-activated chloride channel family protein